MLCHGPIADLRVTPMKLDWLRRWYRVIAGKACLHDSNGRLDFSVPGADHHPPVQSCSRTGFALYLSSGTMPPFMGIPFSRNLQAYPFLSFPDLPPK